MGWLRMFRREEKVDGELGFLGLGPWWLATFDRDARTRIETVYRPTNTTPRVNPLTQGKVTASYHTPVGLLAEIGEQLVGAGELGLAQRVYAQAEEIGQGYDDALDLHLLYHSLLLALGKPLELGADARSLLVETCRKQIALAPAAIRRYRQSYPHYDLPSHVGYTYLAGLYEVDGEYAAAIQLAEEAHRQGWTGDWAKRIARCQGKAAGEIPPGGGEELFRLLTLGRGALGSPVG